MNVKDKAEDKASEEVTLKRSQVWLLQISAATGVMSLITHGLQFLQKMW